MHNEMKAFSIILLLECDNLNKNNYYSQAYDLIDKWRKEKTDKYTTQEDKNLSVAVVVHKTGFEKQILWQLPDKGY